MEPSYRSAAAVQSGNAGRETTGGRSSRPSPYILAQIAKIDESGSIRFDHLDLRSIGAFCDLINSVVLTSQ